MNVVPTVAAGGLILDRIRIAVAGRTLIDLSAIVRPGSVVTVMGPSGAGKSTLLAYVGGHLTPAFTAAGRIILGGVDVTGLPAHRRRIGILFQDPLLFPHLSVLGNLLFALPPGGGRGARRRRAEAALAEIGLEGFGDRDPATLSGGQQARVALMRVLLSEPAALLLDEPFAKLDRPLRAQIRALVVTETVKRQLPVLLVTHDAEDAAAAGGEVIRL